MTQSQQSSALAEDSTGRAAEILEELRADIVALSEGKLSLDEVDPSGDVFDYGYLSSLTAVIFLTQIEERYGVEIEDLELVEVLTTLQAVAQRICEPG